MAVVYMVSGECQFYQACHAAGYGYGRSDVSSPEYGDIADALGFFRILATDKRFRRCPSCQRPIALKWFELREIDYGGEIGYRVLARGLPKFGDEVAH